MNELGRLEDLPVDYREALTQRNLVPLWPNLRAVLPPQVPTRKTRPTFWAYSEIKPLLLQAGELTPIAPASSRRFPSTVNISLRCRPSTASPPISISTCVAPSLSDSSRLISSGRLQNWTIRPPNLSISASTLR